jgi:hypothetical protein
MIDNIIDITRKPKTSAVRPEEVLLQITLAFMVFLGFLVSDEVVSKIAFQYQLDGLERGLADANGLKIEEIHQLRLANQKHQLLEKWWKKRETLPLFYLTSSFSQDPNSPLHNSTIDELRTNPSFQELHRLSNLYFARGSEENRNDKISRLVETITEKSQEELAVLRQTQEGLALRSRTPTAKKATQSDELKQGVLQIENVNILKTEIEKDFNDQKNKVADIQHIAFTRFLGKQSNEHNRTLEQLINDWNKDLPMLPEVLGPLRKTALLSTSSN